MNVLVRTAIFALISSVVVAVGGFAAQAQPYDAESDAVPAFYEELEPYGRWQEHPRFGEIWVPFVQRNDVEWRPYTRGQWVYTDDHGWYWESEEPFGWATYHYGRWYFDTRLGWAWVPGSEWGPAWVAWRESDDYVGWAPLPPDAVWDEGYGYRVPDVWLTGPQFAFWWYFVEPRYLTAPRVVRHLLPRDRARFVWGRTRAAAFHGRGRVFNRGIDARRWARRTGRDLPLRRLRVIDGPRAGARAAVGRGEVGVFRPRFGNRGDRRREGSPPRAGSRDRRDGGVRERNRRDVSPPAARSPAASRPRGEDRGRPERNREALPRLDRRNGGERRERVREVPPRAVERRVAPEPRERVRRIDRPRAAPDRPARAERPQRAERAPGRERARGDARAGGERARPNRGGNRGDGERRRGRDRE